MLKNWHKVALLFGAIILPGCYMTRQPGPILNFLSGGKESLANALKRAAADWARHGLDVANYVTVDDGPAGLPVMFASAKELAASCPKGGPPDLWGCTNWWAGDWQRMLIRADLEADPVALSYIVQHEMVHALVPKAPHLPGDQQGIFSRQRTVDYVTRADMAHLSRWTEVVESDVPFVEDADRA